MYLLAFWGIILPFIIIFFALLLITDIFIRIYLPVISSWPISAINLNFVIELFTKIHYFQRLVWDNIVSQSLHVNSMELQQLHSVPLIWEFFWLSKPCEKLQLTVDIYLFFQFESFHHNMTPVTPGKYLECFV